MRPYLTLVVMLAFCALLIASQRIASSDDTSAETTHKHTLQQPTLPTATPLNQRKLMFIVEQ